MVDTTYKTETQDKKGELKMQAEETPKNILRDLQERQLRRYLGELLDSKQIEYGIFDAAAMMKHDVELLSKDDELMGALALQSQFRNDDSIVEAIMRDPVLGRNRNQRHQVRGAMLYQPGGIKNMILTKLGPMGEKRSLPQVAGGEDDLEKLLCTAGMLLSHNMDNRKVLESQGVLTSEDAEFYLDRQVESNARHPEYVMRSMSSGRVFTLSLPTPRLVDIQHKGSHGLGKVVVKPEVRNALLLPWSFIPEGADKTAVIDAMAGFVDWKHTYGGIRAVRELRHKLKEFPHWGECAILKYENDFWIDRDEIVEHGMNGLLGTSSESLSDGNEFFTAEISMQVGQKRNSSYEAMKLNYAVSIKVVRKD